MIVLCVSKSVFCMLKCICVLSVSKSVFCMSVRVCFVC